MILQLGQDVPVFDTASIWPPIGNYVWKDSKSVRHRVYYLFGLTIGARTL